MQRRHLCRLLALSRDATTFGICATETPNAYYVLIFLRLSWTSPVDPLSKCTFLTDIQKSDALAHATLSVESSPPVCGTSSVVYIFASHGITH